MTATLRVALPAPPLGSFHHRASRPTPWHVRAAARRAVAALAPAFEARVPRIRAALDRPPAFNAVARSRLFWALVAALDAEVPHRHHQGRRHEALTATALAPGLPYSHQDWEEPGIVVDRLLCLAGKSVGIRGIHRVLEVNLHACMRFVERSGCADPATLHNTIREAAEHVPALLMVHLDGDLAYRLRGGTAPILLPAGEGAFLGFLRLLPADGDTVRPVVEATTWLHTAALDTPQLAAQDVQLAGLPPATLLAALPAACAGLQPSVMGDRRVLDGLKTVPLDICVGSRTRAALRAAVPVTSARLVLDLACPDTIASEKELIRAAIRG